MSSEARAPAVPKGRVKIRARWIVLAALPIAIALIAQGAMAGHSPADIPAGTGYSALDMCTRTMQSGETLEHVRSVYVEPKVDPLQRFWNVEYVRGQRVRVSTRLPLLAEPRSAVYRPGLGCTLVSPDTTEAAV